MARKSTIPTDISLLFNSSSSTLAQIAEKTNYLTSLNEIIQQICPDIPEGAWKIANIKGNTIVLETSSAVWSQRLQFERNHICRQLTNKTYHQFSNISIMVRPKTSQVKVANIKHQSQVSVGFSQATAQQLLSVAKTAPKGLKEKLEKLASHSKG